MSMIFVAGKYGKDEKFVIYLCFSISIFCLLCTLLVYLLNLKQLNLILEQRRFPLRKTRAWFISNLCFVFMVWQILLILYISLEDTFQPDQKATFVLMVFVIYFSVSFYCWCFAWSLVILYLTRYHLHMLSEIHTFRSCCISIACYIQPAFFVVVFILIGYYTNDRKLELGTVYHIYSKWMLISWEVIVILMKLSIISYTFKVRIAMLKKLNFTGREIVKRVWQTNALRNGSIFQVFFLLTVVSDVVTVSENTPPNTVLYIFVAAQTLMAIHLLTFVTLLHDENFRKPFRSQRQKKAIRNLRFKRKTTWRRDETVNKKDISVIYKQNLPHDNNLVFVNGGGKLSHNS